MAFGTNQNAKNLNSIPKTKLFILKTGDILFIAFSFLIILIAGSFLFAVVVDIFADGLHKLNLKFFTSFPSRKPEEAGILSAWVGTLCLISIALPFSAFFGIAAGIYLEEYAPKNIITKLIEININNLAAVPSIVYGLLALGIFAETLQFGESILTGGLALGLLMMPVIVVTTRESVRAVPQFLREASYALGSTKWETVIHHVLPYSMGGIITGIIIALARAVGETAPIITVGALAFIAFLPPSPIKSEFPFISFDWLTSPFTALPIQMFNWISRPQKEFHENAAAVGIVLIVLTALLISVASAIRWRFRKMLEKF